jgi:hypothetical protein
MRLVTAVPDDAARVARFLCDEMYPEMDLGFAPLDEGETLDTVYRLTMAGGVHFLLEGDRIVGGIGLEPRRFWWSKQQALGDYFLYVAPSHRRGIALKTLINAAHKAAREAGLPLILGGFGSPRLSLFGRLLRLLGFQEIGSLYLWR